MREAWEYQAWCNVLRIAALPQKAVLVKNNPFATLLTWSRVELLEGTEHHIPVPHRTGIMALQGYFWPSLKYFHPP